MSTGSEDEMSQSSTEYPRIYEDLPLPQPKQCIRLLRLVLNDSESGTRLCGNLEVVDFGDNPKYAALSYAWSYNDRDEDLPANAEESVMYCNNTELRVTRNCYDALSSIRDLYGSIRIWVDAICINQKDEKEKASQIGIMADIYTWANTVYVWLGPGSIATERAIDCLTEASKFRVYIPGIPWASDRLVTFNQDKFWLICSIIYFQIESLFPYIQWFKAYRFRKRFNPHDVNELLDSKWAHRAWTYQEIVFSSNPVIVCGGKPLSWSSLQRGIDYLENPIPSYELEAVRLFKYAFRWIGILDYPWPVKSPFVTDELARLFHHWKSMHRVWKEVCRRTTWNDERIITSPTSSKKARNSTSSVAEYQKKFIKARKTWFDFEEMFVITAVMFVAISKFLTHHWDDGPWGTTTLMSPGDFLAVIWRVAVAFLIMIAVAPVDNYYTQTHTLTQLLTETTRTLREREATEAADKAFALHEVFGNLNIQISSTRADYHRPVGEVYQTLFIELLRRHGASFINLLIDSGGPEAFPGLPSWVPDWSQTHKNDWNQSDFIYEHIEYHATEVATPQMKISNNKLGLWAVRKDVIREPLSNMAIGSKTPEKCGLEENSAKLARSFAQRISRAFKRASDFIPDSASDRMYLIHCEVLRALRGRNPPPEDDQYSDIKILNRWVNLSQETSLSSSTLSAAFQDDDQLWPFMARCYRCVRSRVMLFTTEGLYGTGPPGMAASDQIVWLKGVAIPMILRPVESGGSEFKVIGPAVVPGLMDLSVLNENNYGHDWEVVYLI